MKEYERELNEEQLRVVYEGDGPCLVLSGPGSGKTRTLVYRSAYLLEKDVFPERILLLTFTKKAAKEMFSRILRISNKGGEKICGGTFHHVGNLFLKKYASRIGYSSNFTIIDEDDSKNLIATILKETDEGRGLKAQVVKKIISLSTNSNKNIEKVVEDGFFYLDENITASIPVIADYYKKRKKENNLMDYDDLLFNWLQLLSYPDIQEEISSRFLYILIDEYQDTNRIQDDIVKKLSKVHGNILAVGDDAQSIYSFRAADIENILSFSKSYPKAKIFRLESNYRSTPEILDVANNVIKKNEKKLDKTLKSVHGSGSVPTIISFSNSFEQAKFIVDEIEKINNLDEVAVLFRAHYQCAEIEIELAKRRVPYIVRGGVRFFEQFHIKDVFAFLRILTNFYDETSWRRLLLRQEGVGEIGVKKIISKIKEEKNINSLAEKKDNIAPSRLATTGLSLLLSLLQRAEKEKRPEKIISIFLQGFYNEYLDLSFENARERKGDIKKVAELSTKYEDIGEMTDDLSLSEDFKGGEFFTQSKIRARGKVTLSTVHQAKGLEWGTVFIVSLKEGGFPHAKSIEDGLIEEERRLFYVAVTRCKRNLFLTYPLYSLREKELSSPSRFLEEMESEVYDSEERIVEKDSEEWEPF